MTTAHALKLLSQEREGGREREQEPIMSSLS